MQQTLTVTPVTAQITAPAKGSTLAGSTVTFTWTKQSYATQYRLWVGSTPGSNDIAIGYSNGPNPPLSVTINNLPTDGRTVYVTLYANVNSSWSVKDTATYTAAAPKAAITSPAKGSTFVGTNSVRFTWTAETGATSYQLWVGSTPGAQDIALGTTSALAITINNLPTDGRTLYVTLYGNTGGWAVQDTATYTASTFAIITSPTKESTLTGSTVTFTWTAEAGATAYRLWVGSTPGASDIAIGASTGLSVTIRNLPVNGQGLYMTLYGNAGARWVVQDTATYTAAAPKAAITSPAKGSTFVGTNSVRFTWTAETGATSYQLWVGSTPGAQDIALGTTSALAITINNLPTDGRTLYVTLYGNTGGWAVQDTATYTAFH